MHRWLSIATLTAIFICRFVASFLDRPIRHACLTCDPLNHARVLEGVVLGNGDLKEAQFDFYFIFFFLCVRQHQSVHCG